jgi:farnesyl diphosphate synthase
MDNFAGRLTQRADEIAILLGDLLGTEPLPGEIARPERLIAAMRHGVLNGGKRLRPFLLVETALMLGGSHGTAMRAAAALECVHCYSLIHDDLPAMDDDDLRRGQPTVHRAFDEATAILAGDALLTLAFDILADPQTHEDPAIRSALVLALARASGMGGMAGGQMLDLAAEHRQLGVDEIGTMQSMKTGALIRCACEMGAIAADADPASAGALRRFGELAGKAFQLADDILDVTQSTAALGKQAAKDEGRGKATLVSLLGIGKSREITAQLMEQAIAALEPFGDRSAWLEEAARYIVGRDH